MKQLLTLVGFVVLVGLAFVLGQQTERQNSQISVEQLQQRSAQESREQAERIVREVRRLIVIPEEVEPTVATIVDVESLQQRNPFYANAKNGDHLVVTSNRAILYDSEAKQIIDVVPIQLEPGAQGGAQPQAQLLEDTEETEESDPASPPATPGSESEEKPKLEETLPPPPGPPVRPGRPPVQQPQPVKQPKQP